MHELCTYICENVFHMYICTKIWLYVFSFCWRAVIAAVVYINICMYCMRSLKMMRGECGSEGRCSYWNTYFIEQSPWALIFSLFSYHDDVCLISYSCWRLRSRLSLQKISSSKLSIHYGYTVINNELEMKNFARELFFSLVFLSSVCFKQDHPL